MIKQLLICFTAISILTSCVESEESHSSARVVLMEDTLYLTGTIVHHKHINSNSGVLMIKIDTSNVQHFNGIYGNVREGSGFGLITPDTAFVITEVYDRIIADKKICFQNGYWLIHCSDSLQYQPVNNIVGTFDKSRKYISAYRGDGVLENYHYLGQFIFMGWTLIIMFIVWAIALIILKVKT